MKRGGPLARRTPLKAKATLKRSGPIKARSRKPARTRIEERHFERVAALPCCVPGCGGRSTIHHVSASIHGGRITRSDRRVAPLCPRHHQIQHGPRESVEALSHRGFHARYGIDLLALADALWAETEAECTA